MVRGAWWSDAILASCRILVSIQGASKVRLWEDAWMQDVSMDSLFPALYIGINIKNYIVAEVVTKENGTTQWELVIP